MERLKKKKNSVASTSKKLGEKLLDFRSNFRGNRELSRRPRNEGFRIMALATLATCTRPYSLWNICMEAVCGPISGY